MRPLIDMDTVQIEITNACHNSCSNCTRLCGHYEKPYFMPLEEVKAAIDSMKNYPNMTGIMGGEPLLHPEFKEICEYLQTVIPKEKCGLWSCFPRNKEHYREVIVATFGNIFLNDHTRDDVLHGPVLVASSELPLGGAQKDYLINHCWVQNSWSASINPKGAWFCEVAGALAMLLNVQDLGWKVEDGWWARSPVHFVDQMKMCHSCGCAMPLEKRYSVDERDDISEGMLEKIKDTSPKIKKEKYEVYDKMKLVCDARQAATYKDEKYRDAIAKRYGMFLMVNEKGFNEPYLMKNFTIEEKGKD
jgi:hypothetical protein